MNFFELLKEAIALLRKEPKLFIPKIFLALLFTANMLFFAFVMIQNTELFELVLSNEIPSPEQLEQISSLLAVLLLILLFLIFSVIIDILIDGMYPLLINDYKNNRRISLKKGFQDSRKKALKVVPAGLLLIALVVVPLSILLSYAISLIPDFSILSLLVLITVFSAAFMISLCFYFFYPSIMLEKEGIFQSIGKNFSSVSNNLKTVSKANTIPFTASIISVLFAAASVLEPAMIIAFIAFRLLTAVIFTYHMVLSPSIYLKVKK